MVLNRLKTAELAKFARSYAEKNLPASGNITTLLLACADRLERVPGTAAATFEIDLDPSLPSRILEKKE